MLGVAPRQLVVGDVGELGEDREGADQDQHSRHVEPLEPLGERQVGLAVAVVADRVAADVLHPFEGARPVLVGDDFAQQAAEQPDAGPAGRRRRTGDLRQGLRLRQGGHVRADPGEDGSQP